MSATCGKPLLNTIKGGCGIISQFYSGEDNAFNSNSDLPETKDSFQELNNNPIVIYTEPKGILNSSAEILEKLESRDYFVIEFNIIGLLGYSRLVPGDCYTLHLEQCQDAQEQDGKTEKWETETIISNNYINTSAQNWTNRTSRFHLYPENMPMLRLELTESADWKYRNLLPWKKRKIFEGFIDTTELLRKIRDSYGTLDLTLNLNPAGSLKVRLEVRMA